MGQLLPGFFFLGGWGGGKNFVISTPSGTCPHFLDQGLSPPPSQGLSPKIWKIKIYFCDKFYYFQAQKYLKKLYFMLKIAKTGLILH